MGMAELRGGVERGKRGWAEEVDVGEVVEGKEREGGVVGMVSGVVVLRVGERRLEESAETLND
jgi:hypothetical protein